MGVPKFAAWLRKKYPSMVMARCPGDVHGLYIDLNGLIHPCCHDEHDPSVALRTEEEKLRSICLAIETLVVTVRPQHLLYIAIDGVAPRAKMNQQRLRRYMSAAVPLADTNKTFHGDSHGISETMVAAFEEFTQAEFDEVERELEDVSQALMKDVLYGGGATMDLGDEATGEGEGADGLPVAPPTALPTMKSEGEGAACGSAAQAGRQPTAWAPPARFDSNCISPGTVFMDAVAAAVRDYIHHKLAPKANDGGDSAEVEAGSSPSSSTTINAPCAHWAGLTVVFSDSNTAGEGEHKLVDFLRTQSAFPGFNGSGCHVIAGLDADLIFLSLSLHIPRVVILRDNNQSSYEQALLSDTAGGTLMTKKVSLKAKTPQVREALVASSLTSSGTMTLATASPRHIADMVVKPCISYEYFDIDVVGSSLVSEVYQLCLENCIRIRGDPLTCAANCVAANGFCFYRYNRAGGGEDGGGADIDGTNSGAAKVTSPTANKGDGKSGEKPTARPRAPPPPFHPCTSTGNSKIVDDFIVLGMLLGNDFLPHLPSVYCGESAMDTLMDVYTRAVLPYGYLTGGKCEIQLAQLERLLRAYAAVEAVRFRQFAIQSGTMTPQEAATPELCSAADRRCWRDVYVCTTSLRDEAGTQAACRSYVEGLQFVWCYYSSVSLQVSWAWYYPFHHAPLALDIADFLRAQGPQVQTTLAALELEGQPPSPFCQLLCILPPPSRQLVPEALRAAMTSPPAELVDTFPHRWVVDRTGAYGKDHLAAVLLPFANLPPLQGLVAAASGIYTAEEKQRNTLRFTHYVFEGQSAQLARRPAATSTGAVPATATAENLTNPAVSQEARAAPFSKPRRASPVRTAPPVRGSATTMMRGFRIQGSGLRALSAEEVPANMRDCTTIACFSLAEIAPPLSRPRTYSYAVPIPCLTALPYGGRVAAQRRPRHRRGVAQSCKNENACVTANNATGAQASTPAVLFGEFAVCLAAMGVLTAGATVWHSFSLRPLLRSGPILLQLCCICATVIWLAFALGLAVTPKGRSAGSGQRRHRIFTAFVDWQCSVCLSLNFSRNRRCFMCCAPYDPHRCVALFSSCHPPEPPLMDPDHSAYAECYGIPAV
ncbi:5'-3' exoribonuclease B, putative [Leishmania guyanensis]|uniref:5'-3' exonuclease, putative n=1 Tax=Leishmania guyanensis TaxID=5670 RepID=A0A1E1IVH5_LEIGU|nr:5'-3' exonuclease, putative [Leishmania guyanensis]